MRVSLQWTIGCVTKGTQESLTFSVCPCFLFFTLSRLRKPEKWERAEKLKESGVCVSEIVTWGAHNTADAAEFWSGGLLHYLGDTHMAQIWMSSSLLWLARIPPDISWWTLMLRHIQYLFTSEHFLPPTIPRMYIEHMTPGSLFYSRHEGISCVLVLACWK